MRYRHRLQARGLLSTARVCLSDCWRGAPARLRPAGALGVARPPVCSYLMRVFRSCSYSIQSVSVSDLEAAQWDEQGAPAARGAIYNPFQDILSAALVLPCTHMYSLRPRKKPLMLPGPFCQKLASPDRAARTAVVHVSHVMYRLQASLHSGGPAPVKCHSSLPARMMANPI